MKWIFCFACGSACYCMGAFGQTNSSDLACGLFSLPPVRLRALPSEAEKTGPPTPTGRVAESVIQAPAAKPAVSVVRLSTPSGHPAGEMSLSTEVNDFDPDLYRRLEQSGCFTRRSAPSENAVTRCVDAVFRPEVVHIGKTAFSCSIITAIVRKDPLCLLNPIFLNLSW
jgi:hypothetical protein